MTLKKIEPAFVPLILFFFSLILRLMLISKGPFHVDCLNLILKAEETITTHRIQPLPGFGYPLTVLLAAVFITVLRSLGFPDPAFAANFMSVFFGASSIPIFYLFVKKLLDDKTALLSALAFSLYPFFLGVSLFGMSHTPAIFFLLTGLLFLEIHKTRPRTGFLILGGVALGLMGAARLQDLGIMLVPISFFYLFVDGQPDEENKNLSSLKSRSKFFVLLGSVTFGIVLLFHWPLLFDPAYRQASVLNWFWQAQLTNNYLGLLSLPLKMALKMIITSLSLPGAVIALLGYFYLTKKDIKKFLFLALWLLIPLFFYGNLYTTTSRFLIIAVIPLIIAEGYCLSIWIFSGNRILRLSAALLFCLALSLSLREVYPVFQFRHGRAPLVEFSRWIGTVTEPNASIIAADDRLFIGYYSGRYAQHNPCGIYFVQKEYLAKFQEQLDTALRQGNPVYITTSGLNAGDITHEFRDFMQTHYTLTLIGRHLSEDWHQGEAKLNIGQDYLYKISLPPSRP